jgi:hypothetical protein
VKSFLELKVIHKNEHLFEFAVAASNPYFSGATEVYGDSSSLLDFANSLAGFPASINANPIEHKTAPTEATYFSMKFYCVDKMGHIAVRVIMGRGISDFDSKESDKMEIEILVDPASIDSFRKELEDMARHQEGSAILNGR